MGIFLVGGFVMSISEKTVHNISEYISSITDLKTMHNKLWFRGHSAVDYALQVFDVGAAL